MHNRATFYRRKGPALTFRDSNKRALHLSWDLVIARAMAEQVI